MDVKDLTVSFVNRRRAITNILAKFQNPALNYMEHCISGTAMYLANVATCSHVVQKKEEVKGIRMSQNSQHYYCQATAVGSTVG